MMKELKPFTARLKDAGTDEIEFGSTYLGRLMETASDELACQADTIKHLQQTLKLKCDVETEQFWYWQGDGHDHPESLVCPIVISAQDLRDLLPRATLKINEVGTVTRSPIIGDHEAFDEAMKIL